MKRSAGFTLIELMIVVLVIGLLASIAIPSYRSSVLKGHRAAAKSAMMDIASRQENFYVDRKSYPADLAALVAGWNATMYVSGDGQLQTGTGNAVYSVTSAVASGVYTITAVPYGSQADDTKCGTLTLASTGARGATGTDGAGCWKN